MEISDFLNETGIILPDEIDDFLSLAENCGIELEKFLHNKIFSINHIFTDDDYKKIAIDIGDYIDMRMCSHSDHPNADTAPMYIGTAGAPGTGKSHFLQHSPYANRCLIANPNEGALNVLTGYQQDQKKLGKNQAYNKWRDISNFFSNFVLTFAISNRLNVIHDTTAQSERIIPIYQGLKSNGYRIAIHCFFADSDDRAAAIKHRQEEQELYLVTPEDAIEKVKPIFKMLPNYQKHADELRIYWQEQNFWSLPAKGAEHVINDSAVNFYSIIEGCEIHNMESEYHSKLRAQIMEEANADDQEQALAVLGNYHPKPILTGNRSKTEINSEQQSFIVLRNNF